MTGQQEITYHDAKNFYAGIAAAVIAGLTFTADGDALKIVFTGGY